MLEHGNITKEHSMNIKKRILIIFALVIVFIIIAPLAIYYARGFRFDFKAKRFTPTGTLIIKSDPAGAQILLNGEEYWRGTPVSIRYLLPGEYQLEVVKENYISWKRAVNILPSTIVNVPAADKKITLFLENPKITFISTSTEEIFIEKETASLSTTSLELLRTNIKSYKNIQSARGRNGQVFALVDKNLYNLTNNKLEQIDQNIDQIFWDEQSETLLYYNANNIWIFRPSISQRTQLITRSSKKIEHAQINEPSGQVFYLESGKIKTVEIDSDLGRHVLEIVSLDQPIEKFLVKKDGQDIFYFIPNLGLYSAQIR